VAPNDATGSPSGPKGNRLNALDKNMGPNRAHRL
jgi:hypothetical protein